MSNVKGAKKSILIRLGLVVFGLALVVGWFVPVNIKAANSDINVKVCYPAPNPPPTIQSPNDGTSTTATSVIMSGEATPGATVYAFRDDVQVGFVSAGGDGSFAISVGLNVGWNSLKASTNDDCDDPAYSGVVDVRRVQPTTPPSKSGDGPKAPTAEPTYQSPTSEPSANDIDEDSKTPVEEDEDENGIGRLIILEPKHGDQVSREDIRVVGLTDALTRVRVLRNGEVVGEVVSDESGRFTIGIILLEGDNKIVVQVENENGMFNSEPVFVEYNPIGATGSWWTPFRKAIAIAFGAVSFAAFLLFISGPRFHGYLRRNKFHGLGHK